MIEIKMDLLQTIGLAGLSLIVGYWLKKRWLKRLTIPAAVIGGLIFAIINTIFYQLGIGYITVNTGLNDFFMVLYFTTIGLGASIKNSRGLGKSIVMLLGLTIIAIFVQNFVAVGIGKMFGVDSLVALMMGSPALVGGPGCVAAIAPAVEKMGYSQAMTAGMISATIGISAGGLLAGPIGSRIIERHKLSTMTNAKTYEQEAAKSDKDSAIMGKTDVFNTMMIILVCMFFGSFITRAINFFMGIFMDNISFPVVLGPMILGFVFRYISDKKENDLVSVDGVDVVADVSLDLFLGLTIINLQFWTIFEIAVPMIVILVAGIIITLLFAYFIIYYAMGRNYDAAVMSAGFVGYGCGTTSNAMSGMREVTNKYGPSPKSFLTTSIICGVFLDFANVLLVFITMGLLN